MQDEKLYIDLEIKDRDMVLDSGTVPRMVDDRVSIGQDIKHAIFESGLARFLVAERSPTNRDDIKNQIELLVEQDIRLVPGTVEITELAPGQLFVAADTAQFGPVEVYL